MPELPEVETVKRIVEPQLKGRTILKVNIANAQVIAHPDAESFATCLTGKQISSMRRRGKFLEFILRTKAGCTCISA